MKRPHLLDVNVLVALFDPDHAHHDSAHEWFGRRGADGWATCPITENGLVRILSNPAYSRAEHRADDIGRRLELFRTSGHHVFWPDDVSISDPRLFHMARLMGHRQLTDAYLLGLAMRHGGRLATFDRSIPVAVVKGAGDAHLSVIPA